jgi:dienelactone hydrolase
MLFGLAAVVLLTANGFAEGKRKPSSQTFENGAKKKVTVELFEPEGKGPFPAVILLHDSAGLEVPGPLYRFCCQTLADEGYVTLLVHYFDGTPFKEVKPKDVTSAVFRTWMGNVSGAITYARGRANVDKTRIGLIGFSLGGHLSLAVASEQSPRVAAVVEFFGGLPNELWQDLKHLPPTLIVHGDKDTIISVREAYALRGFLEAKNFPYEFKMYEGQKHLFAGKNPLSDKDIRDARLRALAFFRKHLKNETLGQVKRVDAANNTLRITVFDGTELVFVLAKGVKVIGPAGAQSADGLKAKWLKEGTEVLVLSRTDYPLAREIKLVSKRQPGDKDKKGKEMKVKAKE